MKNWLKAVMSGKSVADLQRDELLAKFAAEKDNDEIVQLSDALYDMARQAIRGYRDVNNRLSQYIAPIHDAYIAKLDDIDEEYVRMNVVTDLQNFTWTIGFVKNDPVNEHCERVQKTLQAFTDAALKANDPQVAGQFIIHLQECLVDYSNARGLYKADFLNIAKTARDGAIRIMNEASDTNVQNHAMSSLARISAFEVGEHMQYGFMEPIQNALADKAKNASNPYDRVQACKALYDTSTGVMGDLRYSMREDHHPEFVRQGARKLFDLAENEPNAYYQKEIRSIAYDYIQTVEANAWLEEDEYVQLAGEFIQKLPHGEFLFDTDTGGYLDYSRMMQDFINRSPDCAAFIGKDTLQELGYLKPETYDGTDMDAFYADMHVTESYLANKDQLEKQPFADSLKARAQQITDELLANVTDIKAAEEALQNPKATVYTALVELQQKLECRS